MYSSVGMQSDPCTYNKQATYLKWATAPGPSEVRGGMDLDGNQSYLIIFCISWIRNVGSKP